MIFAGIDEAGLGPILGPLVTSATAFRVADADGPCDLWERLASVVSRKTLRKSDRVAIGDSKKLYNRKKEKGLAPLERGVLTMLLSRVQPPETKPELPVDLAALLAQVAPGTLKFTEEYPWYGPCDFPLPHHAGAMDCELTANSVKVAMRQAGVELLVMRSEPLFVRQFNQRIAATDNKSTTTLDLTYRRLMDLWQSLPYPQLHITIDRQGGRTHYREALQRMFDGGSLKVVEESEKRSAYVVQYDGRMAEIEFLVGAESKSLPVALASMVSKYLRELFMERFNGYWQQRVDGLESTAGYYVDGKRFYEEIVDAMAHLNVPEDMVLRCR